MDKRKILRKIIPVVLGCQKPNDDRIIPLLTTTLSGIIDNLYITITKKKLKTCEPKIILNTLFIGIFLRRTKKTSKSKVGELPLTNLVTMEVPKNPTIIANCCLEYLFIIKLIPNEKTRITFFEFQKKADHLSDILSILD